MIERTPQHPSSEASDSSSRPHYHLFRPMLTPDILTRFRLVKTITDKVRPWDRLASGRIINPGLWGVSLVDNGMRAELMKQCPFRDSDQANDWYRGKLEELRGGIIDAFGDKEHPGEFKKIYSEAGATGRTLGLRINSSGLGDGEKYVIDKIAPPPRHHPPRAPSSRHDIALGVLPWVPTPAFQDLKAELVETLPADTPIRLGRLVVEDLRPDLALIPLSQIP